MKLLKRSILNKDLKRYIGNHTKLKFREDNKWYWFKNFNSSFDGLFLELAGVGIKFKKINDITEIYNTELYKIEDNIMEDIDKKDLEKGVKVEKEHKPTYNKIIEFYNKFKKVPSKEEFYKWIAEDHEDEFPEKEYYKALEKMENELKERKIIKEDIFDNNFTPELQEANTVEKQPEISSEERIEEVIDVRVELENIANTIEELLLAKDKLSLIPIKVNTAVRLQNILGAIKNLRNNLDDYSIITESEDLVSNTEQEKQAGEEEREKEESKQEILYGSVSFEKKDVETILESNYKILSKEKKLWKIAVRNPFRENKESLFNYNLEVFFDKNCLDITPTYLTETTEKLANKVFQEVYEDLQAIKSNKNIISEEIAFSGSYNKASNLFFIDVVKQSLLGEDKNIQIAEEEIEAKEVRGDKYKEAKVDLSIFTQGVNIENYKFSDLLISFDIDYNSNESVSPENEITPEYKTNSINITKVEVIEVMVDGDKIDLLTETKEFLNKVNWKKYIGEKLK